MSLFFYNTAIFFYTFVIRIAAWGGHSKAQKWRHGRQHIFQQLNSTFANNTAPVVWVHCASLGEFEQGRPLIEALKKQHPHFKILLTFFSPSGYEVRKNYTDADWVFYLPLDTKKNALRFISIVRPQQVIFVKYEFWYHYLTTLQQQQIPTYLISASFRPNQAFFKWYGAFFRQMLFCFKTIFVQNQASLDLLHQLNYQTAYVAGDTRLDRVLKIRAQAPPLPIIEAFCSNNRCLVAGSTWTSDEQILAKVLQTLPNQKLIIAPHQINEKHLKEIERLFDFTTCIRYSSAVSNSQVDEFSVLIIDNIGMLSSIYAYAHIAYIGGGFGAGIHNILEAAVFEIPVLFGPNHHKFQEAKDLIAIGVGFEIKQAQTAINCIHQIQSKETTSAIQQQAQLYFQQNSGASDLILQHINITL